MQQTSLQVAKQLTPVVREAVEQLLGRTLRDDEEISVRAYEPHEAPSQAVQNSIAEELGRLLQEVDRKSDRIDPSDREELLDDAIRSVRPAYRSRR